MIDHGARQERHLEILFELHRSDDTLEWHHGISSELSTFSYKVASQSPLVHLHLHLHLILIPIYQTEFQPKNQPNISTRSLL